jgi:hypothetical protein
VAGNGRRGRPAGPSSAHGVRVHPTVQSMPDRAIPQRDRAKTDELIDAMLIRQQGDLVAPAAACQAAAIRLAILVSRRRPGLRRSRCRCRPAHAGLFNPTGRVPVPGRSKASKSTSGMRRSNPTALCLTDNDRATATSAVMTPSLRQQPRPGFGSGSRPSAWLRSWRLTPGRHEVDVTQVARRPGELQFGRSFPEVVGGVEELGAGAVTARAATADRRIPVRRQPHEQDGLNCLGESASRNQIATWRSECCHPRILVRVRDPLAFRPASSTASGCRRDAVRGPSTATVCSCSSPPGSG